MFTPEINDTYDAALIDALGREELGNEMEGPTYVMIDNFFEDLYDGNMHRALGYCDPAVFNDPVDLRFILAGDDEAEGTPQRRLLVMWHVWERLLDYFHGFRQQAPTYASTVDRETDRDRALLNKFLSLPGVNYDARFQVPVRVPVEGTEHGRLVATNGMTFVHAVALRNNGGWVLPKLAAEGWNMDAFTGPITLLDAVGYPVGEQAPLHLACRNRHRDPIRGLVSAGANLNIALGPKQFTPLLLALKRDAASLGANESEERDQFYSVMALLGYGSFVPVAAGADVNLSSRTGVTPLMLAALNSQEERFNLVLGLLTRTGINVNATDTKGRTALHYAAMRPPGLDGSNTRVVLALITKGADWTIRTSEPQNLWEDVDIERTPLLYRIMLRTKLRSSSPDDGDLASSDCWKELRSLIRRDRRGFRSGLPQVCWQSA